MAFAPGPRTAGLRRSFGGRVDAGPSIVMDPSGAELAAGMERWANLVPDFSEAWPHATDLIHRHNSRTFRTRGAGTGDRRRWVRLSPAYRARKARDFPGRGLLVRTSALRDALTGSGSGSRVKRTKDSLEVGIKGPAAEYGKYHQTGVPSRHLPARPPIKFSRNLRNKSGLTFVISQMLQRVVVDHRKAALGVHAGVLDADAADKRAQSLTQLSRRKTV